MNPTDFAPLFQRLTAEPASSGYPPFRWQERLYARLLAGDIPPLCDIPTGLGKTSVLALWLLALAEQASHPDTPPTLPRRLVYIVDRRAVVDQATAEAERLLENLQNPRDPALLAIANSLRGLAAVPGPNGQPFALSTLRGQFADNRDWSHDPARPAMVVGTVDMIGSRLLFSGYGGLGRYGRSQHAALLGQDALVVLDEAQLAPAFMGTLRAIERHVHPGANALRRPFAFMSLTATQPCRRDSSDPDPARKSLTLEPEDLLLEETVRQRVEASKTLRLVPWEGATTGKTDEALAQRMAQEAVELAGPEGAVVVFVNTVTALDKIHVALRTIHSIPDERCLRFNGQMRGDERDAAFADQSTAPANLIFQAFRQRRPRAGRGYPVFLLATSAGEVGVNFDADDAVCDLVTLERMAQRLGRVNRAGDGAARVTIFLPAATTKPADEHLGKTAELLAQLPVLRGADGAPLPDTYSASPAALREILNHSDAPHAFTPTSEPPPLDAARLDDWSLTSLSPADFPRPQVSYWLRGITPDDAQAVTQLVWREELRYARDKDDAADMGETRPPLPREILQVPTYRAVRWLLARAKKHGGRKPQADPHPGEFAAVRTPAGEWEAWPLARFEDKDDFEPAIFGATIILPTTFGGLTPAGFLDDATDDKTPDVLEKEVGSPGPVAGKTCRRVLLDGSPSAGWKAFDLLAGPGSGVLATGDTYPEVIRLMAKKFLPPGANLRYRLQSREDEPTVSAGAGDGDVLSPSLRVEYFVAARVYKGQGVVPLADHLEETRRCAEGIVARLNLPASIRDAVVMAAEWHDLGKRRGKWQRAIGNDDPDVFWAKSASPYYDNSEAEGYRHEFGSLMEAIGKLEQQPHPESDLILHLIAAHHGHGRPGFDERAYDVPRYLHRQCAEAAAGAELRFDRLQRRFGWWGLAYLEALVKCADGIASDRAANPPKTAAPLSGQADLFSRP